MVARSFMRLIAARRRVTSKPETTHIPATDDWRELGNSRARLADVSASTAEQQLERILDQASGLLGGGDPLALRQLPHRAPSRSLARKMTMLAAKRDDGFRRIAAEADRARDSRSWEAGIAGYDRVIAIYPFHPAYYVQRGHCRKELGQFVAAEIDYRDALAFGASVGDVWQHLEFVHAQLPGSLRLYPKAQLAEFTARPAAMDLGRDDMVTSDEVQSLAWLFHGVENPKKSWIARIMQIAPLHRMLAAVLIADPAFYPANRRLVALHGRKFGL